MAHLAKATLLRLKEAKGESGETKRWEPVGRPVAVQLNPTSLVVGSSGSFSRASIAFTCVNSSAVIVAKSFDCRISRAENVNAASTSTRLVPDPTVPMTAMGPLRDVASAEVLLDDLPKDTYLITYNGFGGQVPDSFREVRVDRELPSVLRMWRKAEP